MSQSTYQITSKKKRKSTLRQLPRQWKILQQLENNHYGLSAAQIAASVECEIRTIYRDLEALQEAGFAMITEQKGKESRWKLYNPSKNLPQLPLTEEELQSLYLATKLMKKMEGTVYYNSARSAFSKIRAMLKPGVLENLESFEEHIHVIFKKENLFGSCTPWFTKLHFAMEDNLSVRLKYQAVGQEQAIERIVDPYQVWFYEGENVYLTGYCHLRKALRTFNLQRIQSLEITEQSFTKDLSFSLQQHLEESFEVMTGQVHEVEVLFPKHMKNFLEEKKHHPSQKLEDVGNDQIKLSLQASGLPEIKRWILSFGSHAKVLKPLTLQQEMKQELEKALAQYC